MIQGPALRARFGGLSSAAGRHGSMVSVDVAIGDTSVDVGGRTGRMPLRSPQQQAHRFPWVRCPACERGAPRVPCYCPPSKSPSACADSINHFKTGVPLQTPFKWVRPAPCRFEVWAPSDLGLSRTHPPSDGGGHRDKGLAKRCCASATCARRREARQAHLRSRAQVRGVSKVNGRDRGVSTPRLQRPL